MKKLENLGRSLSKQEQKKIMGGKGQVVCTCNGSDMDTIVCAYNDFSGAFHCSAIAINYCKSHGYSGVSCDYGGGPQK